MNSPVSKEISIEQGHCYLVDMNPPRKSKPGKVRPVIVVQSTDTLQAGSPGVVVIPLTSQVHEENILRLRIAPARGLQIHQASDALLDQVHTIDRSLFLEDLGYLEPEIFQKVQEGVKFLLGF